jgi:hypothetical protein
MARRLAEQMQASIADVRPWNPLADSLLARAEVDQVRVAFNSAVHQAQQVKPFSFGELSARLCALLRRLATPGTGGDRSA